MNVDLTNQTPQQMGYCQLNYFIHVHLMENMRTWKTGT